MCSLRVMHQVFNSPSSHVHHGLFIEGSIINVYMHEEIKIKKIFINSINNNFANARELKC